MDILDPVTKLIFQVCFKVVLNFNLASGHRSTWFKSHFHCYFNGFTQVWNKGSFVSHEQINQLKSTI